MGAPAAQWFDCVYTSEVGFLLGFGHFVTTGRDRRLRRAVFVTRAAVNLLLVTLLLENAETPADVVNNVFGGVPRPALAATTASVSLLLHWVSYGLARKHVRSGQVPFNPTLFALAHLSVVNFIFDLPGRRIDDVKITHVGIVGANVVLTLGFLFVLFVREPLQEAWYCYRPEVYPTLLDYSNGLCPRDVTDDVCEAGVCAVVGSKRHNPVVPEYIHFSAQVTAVVAIIYCVSILDKVRYYQRAPPADRPPKVAAPPKVAVPPKNGKLL